MLKRKLAFDGELSMPETSSKRVCRNLFGPIDREATDQWLRTKLHEIQQEATDKWKFDFEKGVPLLDQGTEFYWEPVSADDFVPEAYKSRSDGLSTRLDTSDLFTVITRERNSFGTADNQSDGVSLSHFATSQLQSESNLLLHFTSSPKVEHFELTPIRRIVDVKTSSQLKADSRPARRQCKVTEFYKRKRHPTSSVSTSWKKSKKANDGISEAMDTFVTNRSDQNKISSRFAQTVNQTRCEQSDSLSMTTC